MFAQQLDAHLTTLSDALRRVTALLRAGYVHVVDADIQAYFDSIPRTALRARVETKVADGRVLALLDAFLQQPGGFDFLGYHFERDRRWPRTKSWAKLKDTVRAKTRRNNGHSLAVIIADVNRTLRGWFEYFKHSQRPFKTEDAWVCTRLRAIPRRSKVRLLRTAKPVLEEK